MMGKRRKAIAESNEFSWFLQRRLSEGGRLFRALLRFLRPTLFLRRIALVLVYFISLFESGLLLVLLLGVLSVFLPFLLLGFALFLLPRRILKHRKILRLAPFLSLHRVIVLDATNTGVDEKIADFAKSFSAEGYAVLVLRGRVGFAFVRNRGKSVFEIAPSVYFALRRQDFFLPKRLVYLEFPPLP